MMDEKFRAFGTDSTPRLKKFWRLSGLGLIVLGFWGISPTFGLDRPAAVAGGFYPSDAAELSRMVDGFLAAAPPPSFSGELLGILVPHAGYVYSGRTAAVAYKSVVQKKKTIILLGPSHRSLVRGAVLWHEGSFETPLGKVPVDEALSTRLLAASEFIYAHREPHQGEHSLEVQLPFLQRAFGDVKIVPLLFNEPRNVTVLESIGKAIAEVVKNEEVLIVMSSDLSHYPSAETARRVDSTLLASMASLDPLFVQATANTLQSHGAPNLETTLCGQAAVVTGLYALKELGATRAVRLAYTNSGEDPKNGDPQRAVGYGAVAFVKTSSPPKFSYQLTSSQKDYLLKMIRSSVAEWMAGTVYKPLPFSKSSHLNFPAAVFVTFTKNGRLRGCLGTTNPSSTLLEAVRYYGRVTAYQDFRFPPVTPEEMSDIHIEVSLLSPMKPVPSHEAIVPRRHGVWLSKKGMDGLFLPSVWDHFSTKEDFLSELCSQKARLPRDCWKDRDTQMKIFTTETFEEPASKTGKSPAQPIKVP